MKFQSLPVCAVLLALTTSASAQSYPVVVPPVMGIGAGGFQPANTTYMFNGIQQTGVKIQNTSTTSSYGVVASTGEYWVSQAGSEATFRYNVLVQNAADGATTACYLYVINMDTGSYSSYASTTSAPGLTNIPLNGYTTFGHFAANVWCTLPAHVSGQAYHAVYGVWIPPTL